MDWPNPWTCLRRSASVVCSAQRMCFLVASSYHCSDILASMLLTCHEEIGHVGRVGRGCYENSSDLSATRRACRARGTWRTTRHTNKLAALHHSRQPVDQSGKSVANWTMKSPDTLDTRDILVASSREYRACRACRRWCHEDAITRKLLPLNLSLTLQHQEK